MKGRGLFITTFLQFPAYGNVDMKRGQTVKIAASGIFYGSVSHCTLFCNKPFHLLSVDLSCLCLDTLPG